ncbi:hypothetical protein RRF57_001257 [Xylaria bambusicola]|uniref:Uncharacterized protein n=1 Tax=Xylaria bambusicola TaxID=326684 RepID=A0AAN7UDK3_9PEZI
MEQITASVRCGEEGEPTTGGFSRDPSTMNIVTVELSRSGTDTVGFPNRNAGRAIRRTPTREMRPETASWMRYGS